MTSRARRRRRLNGLLGALSTCTGRPADDARARDAIRTPAPDRDVAELAHQRKEREVAPCLDARAEDRQPRRVGASEVAGRHRRHRSRPKLRDRRPIHQCDERAARRIHQSNRGDVCRQTARRIRRESGSGASRRARWETARRQASRGNSYPRPTRLSSALAEPLRRRRSRRVPLPSPRSAPADRPARGRRARSDIVLASHLDYQAFPQDPSRARLKAEGTTRRAPHDPITSRLKAGTTRRAPHDPSRAA